MPLQPGSTLGPYTVTAKIGEGGMGEVYQARDTKLDRDVALKVLPEAFTCDPDRLARFEREAKVLASLNHPNIGSIYGLEEAEGVRALVLELIEGPTLADRISEGPIPLDEALPIAKQIAEALEAAHEAGVIHRDLKPANIKVREDGTVKVLDFGLAKALDPNPDADPSQSPTLTAAATQMGVIMGTAAYMSPEQASGQPTDKRGDIWSFGVVLFEMLTGQRLFTGETVAHVMAKVLERDLDLTVLPTTTPAPLKWLLRRCLEREQKRRLRDAGEALAHLEEAATAPADDSATGAAVATQPAAWQRALPLTLGSLLLGGVIVGLTMWSLRPALAPGLPGRWVVSAPPSPPALELSLETELAISPDGRQIIYRAVVDGEDGLYVRPVDRLEGELLSGTAGAGSVFFSPDGVQIGFASNNTLKKVRVSGGSPVPLGPAPGIRGATWGLDDTIIFALFGGGNGLFRVSAAGGEPETLTTVEAPAAHFWPQFLPSGRGVLFAVVETGAGAVGLTSQLAVLDLETGEQRLLSLNGTHPRYLSSGHLVYSSADTLWAVEFDTDRLEVAGDPVPVLEGVFTSISAGANVAVSTDGTLVYQAGAPQGGLRTFVWVDRQGNDEAVAAEPKPYSSVRLSPDGSKVVTQISDVDNIDIWIYDLERDTPTRLTVDPVDDLHPIWTSDGEGVVWTSNRDGAFFDLFSTAADGTGQEERLTTGPNYQWPSSLSGQALVFVELTPETRDDLMVLSMDDEREAEVLVQGEGRQRHPAISPDGRWMAYESNESGQFEVYVRPFPNVGERRWTISRNGGRVPVWSPDGRELFYRRPEDAAMMVAPIEPEPTFDHGSPTMLFDAREFLVTGPPLGSRAFDIHPDGQRFLMIREDPTVNRQDIVIIEDFAEEVKRLFSSN